MFYELITAIIIWTRINTRVRVVSRCYIIPIMYYTKLKVNLYWLKHLSIVINTMGIYQISLT